MYSQDSCVRNIIDDYLKQARVLENEIKGCEERRYKINHDSNNEDVITAADCNTETKNTAAIIFGSIDCSESAVGIRNQRFLKDLEEAKARLRTIASFTPTDQELRVLAGAYRGLLGNVVQKLAT